jgi:hypothetical protein
VGKRKNLFGDGKHNALEIPPAEIVSTISAKIILNGMLKSGIDISH